MIKTVIMGTGRMGSLIRTTAQGVVDVAGQPVFDIVAQIGFDLSELENAPVADVIIDFSNVVTFDAVVAYVERTGAALVSGTTGYTPEQMDRLRELGQNARVMHSGNFSIGIAALRHLVAQATRELPGFDCEIVETHHNQKVDAPSGTAKLLLDAIVEADLGDDVKNGLSSGVDNALGGSADQRAHAARSHNDGLNQADQLPSEHR